MSGIELIGAALAVTTGAFRETYRDRLTAVTRKYRRRRFGLPARILSWLFAFDTDGVQELQRNINTWTDDEVLAWKASYINSCNAISVAGAIFASIGLTALTLPSVGSIQWTSRALLTMSTVFGILSLVSATSQHRNVGLLNQPKALRLWLSRGKVPIQHQSGGRYAYPAPYDTFLLDSSVSAMLIIQFPRVLLNIAVFLYLVGFGLYILFAWLEDVPDSSHDYRNMFIIFITTLGCCAIYFQLCNLSRILEEKKVAVDFNFQRLGIAVPHNQALETLGRTARDEPAPEVNQQQELVQAMRALTTEISQLRQAMQNAR